MADRSRRVRPQVSDDPSDESQDSAQDNDTFNSEGEDEEDFDPRQADAMRRSGRQE
jgi:hypothetical protein